MRVAILALAAVLSACGFRPQKLFASYERIDVREVGRSLYCNSAGEAPAATLFPDLQALLDWQTRRGVTLGAAESLLQGPYAIIEMGVRPTGGYGLAVARSAVVRGDLLILQATFVSPNPGSLRTQAQSSPCVLVQLPPGRYASIEVQDPTGAIVASGGLPQAPADVPPAGATPLPEGTPADAQHP